MSDALDALRRLRRNIEHPIGASLRADIDRRVLQLVSELRRARPETWESELAEVMESVQ